MEKSGTVTKIDGKCVEVKIKRDSACGENCAACGLCKNNEMTLKLETTEKFLLGEEVRLLTDDKTFLKGSAVGYLSLTGLLVLGGIVGALIGSDLLAFALAITFLGAGVATLKLMKPKSLEIKIEKIQR